MDANRFRLICAAARHNIAARRAGRTERIRLPKQFAELLKFESIESFMWYLKHAPEPSAVAEDQTDPKGA